jgi:hypothetical protein
MYRDCESTSARPATERMQTEISGTGIHGQSPTVVASEVSPTVPSRPDLSCQLKSKWLSHPTRPGAEIPIGSESRDRACESGPDPEARAVLDYLASLEGKGTLGGVSGSKNADAIKEVSGKYPAVLALDLSGWNSPPWGDSYNRVVQNSVDRAKAWWQDGGIVAMQLHWIHPSNPNGSAWRGKHGRKEASGPFDFSAALNPAPRRTRN